MVMAMILLAILFLFGFINTYFQIPPNKLFLLIQSCFPNTTKTTKTKGLFSHGNQTKEETKEVISSSITNTKGHGRVELEMVFATFDKNGDGFITKQELGESLNNVGMFSDETELASMVAKLDVNGDGLIDMDEFCELYDSITGNKKREKTGEEDGDHDDDDDDDDDEEMKEAFGVFDGDKDGLISVEELGVVLKSLGLKQWRGVEECKEMIRKVDMDGDGMVSFDEFKLMMKSGTNLVV